MLDAIGETATAGTPRPRRAPTGSTCSAPPSRCSASTFGIPAAGPTKGSAEYHARKEDTDSIFDDALEAVGEIFFY